ncbi:MULTISPECIES: FAD-dependent oxidoreductase [unclassified Roseitalea]|uniref:NAD(P)/FAD-dependent oxidoreductase n=1 Tax=unclassified Roseitalea TaxID=2639107 RepID=UPI00273D96FD|nr:MULTISPECIES: FAD-dependent oxidoreductase [unclassified Roseitalea]
MANPAHRTDTLLVIGAGVIGLSIALAAQARGLAVTVIDRDPVGQGTSSGNAGAFAFPEIMPLASPGIMARAPRWLLDPTGPLAIPPAYAPRLAPWLYRFWRASMPDRYRASIAAQASLMAVSERALEPFMAATGTAAMLRREGQLQVYETEASYRAARPEWDERARRGIDFTLITTHDGLVAHQPGLATHLRHGAFTPGWFNICDPRDYLLALAGRFREAGGAIERTEIRALRPTETGVTAQTGAGTRGAARAVIAAGAWSHLLARTLGDRIPLETERGYNTTLPADAFDLKCQVSFSCQGFVVSRLASGVRVGGAVELGGLDRPPNWKRADALLAHARRLMPGLKTGGGTRWMGYRPSLPDTLPVIGPSRASARIVHAFGHGHLGLTQSAGTAALVADMLTGRPPEIDLAPFSPTRFG